MIIKKITARYSLSDLGGNWTYEKAGDRVIAHPPRDCSYEVLQKIVLHILVPDKPKYNSRAYSSITTGGRQLLLSRYLRLHDKVTSKKSADAETYSIYKEIKKLEKILESTPTFGCEFYLERGAIESLNSAYDFEDKIQVSNILLEYSGNKRIRPSVNVGDTLELRINPSYAPVIVALTKDLFELGILPKDVLVGYSVNMVGRDVLENGVPLILVNYFTGLTPNLPSSEGQLAFRDVHVYHGATVNAKTGLLEGGTPQLNIFAGVTAKVESNGQLMPYKETLENDVQERLGGMLLPFLVNQEYRAMWKQSVFEIFGLTPENIDLLERRLREAEHTNNVWKTRQDLRIFDSPGIRAGLKELYSWLEGKVIAENPQLYLAISDAKL